MKKHIPSITFVMLFALIFLFSCKKDSAPTNTDNSAQVTTQADDQSRVSAETDAVSNDVNTSIESSASMTGRETDIQGLICDASLTIDTLVNPKTITINYNGLSCMGTRVRTGQVVISLPANVQWKNAGSTISVKYNNLKVTRLLDNKSVIINGTHSITNVSGGLLYNLAALPSITHTVTSNDMSITFDDGSKRTWNVARQYVFTYKNGIVATETGTHVDGTNTGIEEWGTTRLGNAFTNAIVEPLVFRQDCSFRVGSGTFKHTSSLATTTVVFGLDASGKPTSCPVGSTSFYLKVSWNGNSGNIVNIILPY